MGLGRFWTGSVFGTNTGKLFLTLEGDDTDLVGTLRHNDPDLGLVVYGITASFDETYLTLQGEPQSETEGVKLGVLSATAALNSKGNLEGEWETDIGTAGVFVLYPHDGSQASIVDDETPDQLHTARHHFGAIEIDRKQIIALAEKIQKEFTNGQVVVTVAAGSEQSRFLPDFKELDLDEERANLIKVYVQELETRGTNKIVSVEFGPQFNWVMTQGADEAWVLGALEKLKRDLRRFERSYTTMIKRFGFGINQVLLLAAIVYLPSLENLRARFFLMAGILALIFIVNRLHVKYLPFAAIYLRDQPKGFFSRVAPSFLSWLIGITAAVVAILLAAYLQGLLSAPTP